MAIGAAGLGVVDGNGGNGEASSLGVLVAANGGNGSGAGGPTGAANLIATGGEGGTAGTPGDLNIPGIMGAAYPGNNGVGAPPSIAPASSVITAGTPLAEQLLWPVKQEAARAYQAGIATDEQKVILHAEASVMGETLDFLYATILACAEQFAAASGMLAGLRRSSNAEIDAASDTNAVSAAVAKVETALKSLEK